MEVWKYLIAYPNVEISNILNVRYKISTDNYLDIVTHKTDEDIYFMYGNIKVSLLYWCYKLFKYDKEQSLKAYHNVKILDLPTVIVLNVEDIIESKKNDLRLMRYLYIYDSHGKLISKNKVHHRYKSFFKDNNLNFQVMQKVLGDTSKYIDGFYKGFFYSKIALKFKKKY